MKNRNFYQKMMWVLLLATSPFYSSYAQNDVMMQAFYWDVPVNETTKNGTWWDNLSSKSSELKTAGITGIWVPCPSKGNWGIVDNGYGIFDHYDLGNYYQKGSTETRFGSRQELVNMLNTMHQSPKIEVYADVVLNHVYSNEENEEVNPAVKAYVFGEAHGETSVPYETNYVRWVIPNAQPGEYYIQIKGYGLNWGASKTERGYNVIINWTGASYLPDQGQYWESEPNNGNGQTNNFPGSGYTLRGHADYSGDIDEYKVVVTSAHDIEIKLEARKETGSGSSWLWDWADQKNGFYPVAVWYNGQNLANSTLQARTNTGISYVNHTGAGEPNYSWNYSHFHPSDANDWLGSYGSDEIITNTIFFGNDFNTFSPVVQSRLSDWGYWLANNIGFDGFRLDFVRGFQEAFVADWVKNLPKLNGSQRFIVGEYWGADYRIKDWVNTVGSLGADVNGFDFPLKNTLTEMCNGDQNSFNMSWLNHAGMVRNPTNSLPGTRVVTFLDNHDTGKEHDKWVSNDWKLGYAYILTHEGRPCVFYPHYYNVRQIDSHNSDYYTQAPAGLKDDMNLLISVRKNYLGGIASVLSETGNPYPSVDTKNVYVARRQGNGTKSGAIVVLNNGISTKGLWVDTSPAGFENWTNVTLVNYATGETVTVEADGRAYFSAPARGYSIWVKQSEMASDNFSLRSDIADTMEEEISAYSDNGTLFINGFMSGDKVQIYDFTGRLVEQFSPNQNSYSGNIKPGEYIIKVISKNNVSTKKVVVR